MALGQIQAVFELLEGLSEPDDTGSPCEIELSP
jgi:hypothetical protein